MIQWFQNIFDSISNFFDSILDGISNVVDKIVGFFKLVAEFVEFLMYTIDLIPYHYKLYGGIIITVLVVMVIVGRESGGDG